MRAVQGHPPSGHNPGDSSHVGGAWTAGGRTASPVAPTCPPSGPLVRPGPGTGWRWLSLAGSSLNALPCPYRWRCPSCCSRARLRALPPAAQTRPRLACCVPSARGPEAGPRPPSRRFFSTGDVSGQEEPFSLGEDGAGSTEDVHRDQSRPSPARQGQDSALRSPGQGCGAGVQGRADDGDGEGRGRGCPPPRTHRGWTDGQCLGREGQAAAGPEGLMPKQTFSYTHSLCCESLSFHKILIIYTSLSLRVERPLCAVPGP